MSRFRQFVRLLESNLTTRNAMNNWSDPRGTERRFQVAQTLPTLFIERLSLQRLASFEGSRWDTRIALYFTTM